MNDVLLIALRHRDNKFGDNSKSLFAKSQVHTSWSKAIIALGYNCIEFPIDRFILSTPNNIVSKVLNAIARRLLGLAQDAGYSLKMLFIFFKFKPRTLILSGASGNIIPLVVYFYKIVFKFKIVFVGTMDPSFYSKSELFLVKRVDLVVNNGHIKAWKKQNSKKSIVLPMSAADSAFHGKFVRDINEPICDIAFIGSIHGPNYKARLEILSLLKDYDLGIWTTSPNAYEILKSYDLENNYKGEVSRLGCPDIYRKSLITINTHAHDMYDGGNLGTFEIPASSGFQIIDKCNLNWFTNSEDLVMFKNQEDLLKKVRFYLDNASIREEIMEKGRVKALSSHTYENRFEEIFQIIKS